MKFIFGVVSCICIIVLSACNKDEALNPDSLEAYLQENSTLEKAFLIACAAGNNSGELSPVAQPINVFFLPYSGATDIRYYETDNLVEDENNYQSYTLRELDHTPVFNGKLRKFVLPPGAERWCIVTYKQGNLLRVSDPIRIKINTKPTVNVNSLVNIVPQTTTAEFEWNGLNDPNNIIYFSVVSELNGDIISGVYTLNKFWNFYDLGGK